METLVNTFIDYVPLATTALSAVFAAHMFTHYRERPSRHILWWTVGVVTFGLGTLSESLHALFGLNPTNLRFWYAVGALWGGFPLAQGSVWLLMPKRFATWSSRIAVGYLATATILVALSPVSVNPDAALRLTGSHLEWSWLRLLSIPLNLYAFIFLVGGAWLSARRYRGRNTARWLGNLWIAAGGLLPGIGGSFTRAGYVEVLFATEFIGLCFIFIGYRTIRAESKALHLARI